MTVIADTVLSPIVPRDTDVPDLGYHYDPVDYIAYRWGFTNCTLTINPGTVIAYYDDTGLWMRDGGQLVCEGTPLALNRLVDYRTVQEQPIKLGTFSSSSSGHPLVAYRYTSIGQPARLRFTQFSRLAGGTNAYNLFVNGSGNWTFSEFSARDCSFHGGTFQISVAQDAPYHFHNNLFDRTSFSLTCFEQANAPVLRNNLFRGGSVSVGAEDNPGTTVTDNAFDATTVLDGSEPAITHNHNAYINTTGRFYPTNASDVVLTNFNYARGPLGRYYHLSTKLLNAGSQTADLAGLYHHTVTTNLVNSLQIKETNSVVDIGYHYVAVDENGEVPDADNDGVPDYLDADSDGDGMPDVWELHFFSDLAQSGDNDFDGDGLTNLEEFQIDSDPTNPDEDSNGIPDGLDDWDGDLLTNQAELRKYFTDPRNPNTHSPSRDDARYKLCAPGILNGPSPSEASLYIQFDGNDIILTLTPTIPGKHYELLGTPSLDNCSPACAWVVDGRTLATSDSVVWVLPNEGPMRFFEAGSGEDPDGDGLPDIYEVLVTRTKPDLWDSSIPPNGISDGDEDFDGDGLLNKEERILRTNPNISDLPGGPSGLIQIHTPLN